MRTSMLDRKVGRTGFLVDSCIKCGYIYNYQITLARPAWHYWVLLSIVVAAAAAVLGRLT